MADVQVPPKQLGSYVRCEDGTIWPDPVQVGEIEYALRYGPNLTREQELVAAGVIAAYRYLLLEDSLTQKVRLGKISGVRAAVKALSTQPHSKGEDEAGKGERRG